MFRPCWVIFREKLSAVVTLGCTIQFSENVLFTVHCTAFGCVNLLCTNVQYKPRPQTVHASQSSAVHSQQHILAQLYSATLV
jgi:hypothetical protein